ncbi:hypothetical protein, partial [Pseudomonas sp. R35(2017)]
EVGGGEVGGGGGNAEANSALSCGLILVASPSQLGYYFHVLRLMCFDKEIETMVESVSSVNY